MDDGHEGARNNIGAARLWEDDCGRIKVQKLDDVIERVNDRFPGKKLIAIKADIEGMELAMLKGALATIAKYKPDMFIEITSDRQMLDIEAILYPLEYIKLYSYAATPVWHFSHASKITFGWRTKLVLFRAYMKVVRFPGRVLSFVKRKLGNN